MELSVFADRQSWLTVVRDPERAYRATLAVGDLHANSVVSSAHRARPLLVSSAYAGSFEQAGERIVVQMTLWKKVAGPFTDVLDSVLVYHGDPPTILSSYDNYEVSCRTEEQL